MLVMFECVWDIYTYHTIITPVWEELLCYMSLC